MPASMPAKSAAAAISGALLLAACGSSAAAGSSSPPSCHAQYEAWKHGPARAVAKRLESALKGVGAAGSAQDIPHLNSALSAAGKDAAALRSWPMPRCADPKGYYGTLLARVTAAGDNAKSASGLGGLLLAMGPLRTVPGIEAKLTAELSQTVGKH